MAETFVIKGGVPETAFKSGTLTEASERLPQGLYTTLRTYHGNRLLRLSDHARRLSEGVDRMDPAELQRVIREVLRRTGFPETRLRLTWAPPQLFVSAEPFEPLPATLYRDGVRCVTVPLYRNDPRSKDTRFIPKAAIAYQRLPPGVHEGLMLGEDGTILEGLSSNVFFVREGILRTEERRALPGVTRSLILEVASGVMRVEQNAVRLAELGGVSECFLTSVSRGILPVVQIDDVTIGRGRPGPCVETLSSRFEALVERDAAP